METRSRNFATLLYPDSMPEDIWEKLDELKIEVYVSPLHDKDKFKNGDLKKPHYHVVLCFDGKKSMEQVKRIVNDLGAVGLEIVESKKSYLRYLCHLDSVDKNTYNTEQVRCFGGANYQAYYEEGAYSNALLRLRKDILKYIVLEREYSFSNLVIYAMQNELDEWLSFLLSKNGIAIREFQRSLQWTNMQNTIIEES